MQKKKKKKNKVSSLSQAVYRLMCPSRYNLTIKFY